MELKMSNNNELEFNEVWKSLEEQDTTGVYKQAREMADLAREQLEYAYNSGYGAAKADVIHLLERWADGYCYIEIPTDDAIKAIKEMKNGEEKNND